MKGLNVSIPFLALAMACSPSDDPSQAPDIAATVESAVAATTAAAEPPSPTDIPAPTPAPVDTPVPVPAQPPTPTKTPRPEPAFTPAPPLNDLWELGDGRVFTVNEIEKPAGTWINRELIVLLGCRLTISDSTQENGLLFSQSGSFSETTYLARVGGSPSIQEGLGKGQCYEMLVRYQSSSSDCYFIYRGHSGIP